MDKRIVLHCSQAYSASPRSFQWISYALAALFFGPSVYVIQVRLISDVIFDLEYEAVIRGVRCGWVQRTSAASYRCRLSGALAVLQERCGSQVFHPCNRLRATYFKWLETFSQNDSVSKHDSRCWRLVSTVRRGPLKRFRSLLVPTPNRVALLEP
jgi:hypothetical protein